MNDLIDDMQAEWAEQRPDIDFSSIGAVVRIQLLAKLLNDNAEQALSQFGLKLWEYDVLSALRRQGRPYEMLASELAQASLLTSGTITTRIDGLENRGLVERRPDSHDRRAINIRLTSKGKELIDKAVAARIDRADEQLSCMTESEIARISSGLRKLFVQMSAHA